MDMDMGERRAEQPWPVTTTHYFYSYVSHYLLLLLLTLLKNIERITSSGVVFRKATLRLPQKTVHTPASL